MSVTAAAVGPNIETNMSVTCCRNLVTPTKSAVDSSLFVVVNVFYDYQMYVDECSSLF